MRLKSVSMAFILGIALILTSTVQAEEIAGFGIRGALGTDITGGIAYGAGANYMLSLQKDALELGIILFGGSFEETTDEGMYTYNETTDIFVFALLANYLYRYSPGQPGSFFIAGFGLGSISVEWEEESPNDESLGTPLPGGGSKQSDEGSAAGTIFNVGAGYSFANRLDLRFEVPVFLTFSAPGEASSVIPTFTLSAGYRF